MSLHTNLRPDAVSSTLYSLSTRRRRVHDSGPTEHLLSAPGSPQGVNHGRGHTDGVPSRRAPAQCQCTRNAFRARCGAQVHVQTPCRSQSNSKQTSSLPGYLASHVSAGSWASCNWLTDVSLLSLMRGRGSRAAAPRNGRTTKEPSLCLFDLVLGIVPQEELAAEADVFPLSACCS